MKGLQPKRTDWKIVGLTVSAIPVASSSIVGWVLGGLVKVFAVEGWKADKLTVVYRRTDWYEKPRFYSWDLRRPLVWKTEGKNQLKTIQCSMVRDEDLFFCNAFTLGKITVFWFRDSETATRAMSFALSQHP